MKDKVEQSKLCMRAMQAQVGTCNAFTMLYTVTGNNEETPELGYVIVHRHPDPPTTGRGTRLMAMTSALFAAKPDTGPLTAPTTYTVRINQSRMWARQRRRLLELK